MAKINIKYLTKKSQLLGEKKDKKTSDKEFWLLRGITFSVNDGEAVGLIGRNGSGKALLLKILAGFEEPTTGFISTNAHIYLASMTNSIDFQATGLDNVKKQINSIYDDEIEAGHKVRAIIDFAEIGQWIYRPVSEYSTGMLSRLALSIALFNKPELILLDEVFSSLERVFFEKVIKKIQELKDNGVSFIITSTTSLVLETLCERSIWMDFGEIQAIGPTQLVMNKFQFQNDWYNGLTLPEKNKFFKEKQYNQENFDITTVYNKFKIEQFEHGYTRRDESRMKKAFYHNHRQDPLMIKSNNKQLQLTANPTNKAKSHKKNKKNKLKYFVSTVLIILLGGTGWALYSNHEQERRKADENSQRIASKHYQSSTIEAKKKASESRRKKQKLEESKKISKAKESSIAASESAKRVSENVASERQASLLANSKNITINRGDTLATLASQYNTTGQIIQEMNNMGDSNALTAGETIKVPNN